MAKRHGIWLLAGSVAVTPSLRASDSERGNPGRIASSPAAPRNDGKTFNRSLLFNPEGDIAAQYDKIHLFDVDIGDGQTYRESARFLAGAQAVTATLTSPPSVSAKAMADASGRGDIKLGMTICYDLRFPQLYRALAKRGATVLAVPSAFTQITGEAHWHVLLRARAIENACFVIAPAQTGEHPGGRKTYGHSLIVDPWGRVLADGGTAEGIVLADLDMEEIKRVRTRLPSLEHDRQFE